MPYIEEERRTNLLLYPSMMITAGELNFLLTNLCLTYLETHNTNYQTLNDIVGALECCKQEFIRRVVNPYEDKKIKENGDVYQ